MLSISKEDLNKHFIYDGPISGSTQQTSTVVEEKEPDSLEWQEKGYDHHISQLEFLGSSYDLMLDNGPPVYMTADEDDCRLANRHKTFRKDPRSLLVKAWESKVFPTIRRRFRSEADRRSGLEQIRGALMEGKKEPLLYYNQNIQIYFIHVPLF